MAELLHAKYEVTTRITNQTISFKLAGAKQAIRGNRLGDDYTKAALEDRRRKQLQERLEKEAKKKAELDAIIQRHVEEEKAKRLAVKKKQEKELFDSMQNLMKTVDHYVKKEDEIYQRIMNVLPDAAKSPDSQEIVTKEQQILENSTLDTVNSFFESSSEINVKPSKLFKGAESLVLTVSF